MEIPSTKVKLYHSTGMPHFEVWIASSLAWNSWIEGRVWVVCTVMARFLDAGRSFSPSRRRS